MNAIGKIEARTSAPQSAVELNTIASKLQGMFAWPTLLLAGAAVFGMIGISALQLAGGIPLWLAMWANAVCAIASFTPTHEASHAAISGRHHGLRWLNGLVGFASGLVCLLDYRMFRRLHLAHHRAPNDPAVDPDAVLSSRSIVRAVGKCLAIIPYYVWHYQTRVLTRESDPVRRRSDRLRNAAFYCIPVAVGLVGYPVEVLTLWVGPAVVGLACACLGHWSLHIPHKPEGRFAQARIIHADGVLGLIVRTVYYGNNDHLIHHLYPRIPFYLQNRAFLRMRTTLEGRGSPIVQLGRRAD